MALINVVLGSGVVSRCHSHSFFFSFFDIHHTLSDAIMFEQFVLQHASIANTFMSMCMGALCVAYILFTVAELLNARTLYALQCAVYCNNLGIHHFHF